MNDPLTALLFFLPAGLANMAPVLANKIPVWNRWNTPMDFGNKLHKTRIFGANKTWRGLTSGIVLGAIIALPLFNALDLELIRGNYLLLGGAMGGGALLGDAIESFFKRQAAIPAGNSWFPFDQLDYIVGGILCSLPFITLPLANYAVIIAVYFGLHILVSYIGFLLKLKDKPI